MPATRQCKGISLGFSCKAGEQAGKPFRARIAQLRAAMVMERASINVPHTDLHGAALICNRNPTPASIGFECFTLNEALSFEARPTRNPVLKGVPARVRPGGAPLHIIRIAVLLFRF